MKIKELFCQKSRTIEVSGLIGRDNFRKITVGMTAELEEGEDHIKNADIQYELLSLKVDMAIATEIDKLKKLTKKK
jgi:hypothetical protein